MHYTGASKEGLEHAYITGEAPKNEDRKQAQKAIKQCRRKQLLHEGCQPGCESLMVDRRHRRVKANIWSVCARLVVALLGILGSVRDFGRG